ncbi:MAG: ABC transporter ATP-binding protein [Aquisalimonadaceae bacterium]
MTVLETRGLRIHIPGRPPGAPLDVRLEAGQRWGLLGPNGVGKTTLLHTLAGLRSPSAGEILLDGEPLAVTARRRIARRVALLFQEQHDSFPATVMETALIGRHPHLRAWDLETPDDYALAGGALERVNMANLADRQVATLSGGERQRLAVASVLTQDPALYLLDEPTNHLDLRHQVQVLETFRQEADRGRVVCMSLHDVNIAAGHCDRLVLMFPDGHLETGDTRAMLERPRLERLYGQPLQKLTAADGTPVFVPEARSR